MKLYIASLFLCVGFHVHAMEEVKLDPSVSCNNICYLNQMSCDILDYIAHFLMETEQEFIERMHVEYQEIQREREEKQKEQGWSTECGQIPMFTAWNIDRTKYLVFFDTTLTLNDYINLDGGYMHKQYSFQEEREINYTSIALSPKARMFACYYYKNCAFEEGPCQEGPCAEPNMNILEITKIDRQKKEDGNHVLIVKGNRQLYFGGPLDIDKIVFNKQANKLIAYDSNKDFNPKIFSLKNIDFQQPQVVLEKTNRLQEYLRDKFVCNNYIEGKK